MAIQYDKEARVFHLQTKHTSYVMHVLKDKYLVHAYWGKRLNHIQIHNAVIVQNRAFSANPDPGDKTYSLDVLPQEYPGFGNTDYRNPAFMITYADGSKVTDLIYDSYYVESGKPKLSGLPSTYVEKEEEASTLVIRLKDARTHVVVELLYTVFEDLDAITRSARIINNGKESIVINRAFSMSLDFTNNNYDMIKLHGAWGRERYIERNPLHHGIQSVESSRGASSHQLNPFIVLTGKNTTETQGPAYGLSLIYSGNFICGAEVDQLTNTRIFAGINSLDFSWTLEPEECFQTPEAVLVFSNDGLGGMSRIYHQLYRTRLIRGKYRDQVRPILINNWEGTYFDFNEQKILDLAKEAANVGIELLVLDDGWFGKRNDDTCSLGDWVVNKEKLPNGLKGLAEKINSYGLKFGLWFEPEMVSVDSELYKNHSDWCIHTPERIRPEARHQLTLDLSRKDVCEYIINAVSSVLDEASISYVKWDMNRHIADFWSSSLSSDRQKEFAHRYILGLYYVMDTIVSSHPDVLFESCSGGGGRFDPGILYYMPQTWASDNTDAMDRLSIQYGTSLCYPVISMGSHVSAVPNHQVGRVTPLSTRGNVAMSGNLGYELDLMKLSEDEKKVVKEQVSKYKEIRRLIQFGDMYRLQSPFDGNTTAWMFLSEDKNDVFAAYFRHSGIPNEPIERVKFFGLDPDTSYQIDGTDLIYGGDELMEIGLFVYVFGDYQSVTWKLRRVQ
jgi:alpha-galactosidase